MMIGSGARRTPPCLRSAARRHQRTRPGRRPLSLIRPAVATAAILRLIDSVKTFDQIYITTQGGPGAASQTLTLYVFDQAFRYLNFGYASALLVLLFTLMLAGNLALVSLRRVE